MCKKSGPLGIKPAASLAGSSAKMFYTVVALIFVSLDVDVVLDEVPTMALSLSVIFL